jgi:hypothetical protein
VGSRRAKIADFVIYLDTHAMDAERINLIGTQLQDLNQRTLDLRGYL